MNEREQTLLFQPVTWEECLNLTPRAMAERSEVVQGSFRYLLEEVELVKSPRVRKALERLLHNPVPSFLALYPDKKHKKAVIAELVGQKLIDDTVLVSELFPVWDDPLEGPQPFWAAPGSDYDRHHSYPGGLAVHTAHNLRIALGLQEAYHETYGYWLDRDTLIAAMILHDIHKPWVLQWLDDGSCLNQAKIAGAGSHHVLSLAESIYRELPPEVVIAQACTHNPPGSKKSEAKVVCWIAVAAVLAHKDPVVCGYLDKWGKHLPKFGQEAFLAHLGDHDWVLSVPAAKQMIDIVGQSGKEIYGLRAKDLNSKTFHAIRNYLFSQVTISRLHQLYCEGGNKAIAAIVKAVIKPG